MYSTIVTFIREKILRLDPVNTTIEEDNELDSIRPLSRRNKYYRWMRKKKRLEAKSLAIREKMIRLKTD